MIQIKMKMDYAADIRDDDGNQEVDHDQTAPDDQTDHQDHGECP